MDSLNALRTELAALADSAEAKANENLRGVIRAAQVKLGELEGFYLQAIELRTELAAG